MKLLLFVLVALQIADGVLTNVLIGGNVAREGNPLLEDIAGTPALLALKITGALLAVAILWRVYRRYRRLAFVATTCFVLIYGTIVIWAIMLL